jgi:hypothetical protein
MKVRWIDPFFYFDFLFLFFFFVRGKILYCSFWCCFE